MVLVLTYRMLPRAKKGGFITLRHNEVRNITADLLNEVCRDVKVEPLLNELNGDELQERATNRSREARLDVSAASFLVAGQKAFFDIRVFDLNARRYSSLELAKCCLTNEAEKKRHYKERVLQVENGTFTPLVFSTNGAMGRECQIFYKRLSEMIPEKKRMELSIVTAAIRIGQWLRGEHYHPRRQFMGQCFSGVVLGVEFESGC
eukprot:gene19778-biopygen16424